MVFFRAVGMTNVGSLVTPERTLSDVRSMIANPLKSASNEDKVHVVRHEFGVQSSSFDEPFIDVIGLMSPALYLSA
jgi:hypothetical protein